MNKTLHPFQIIASTKDLKKVLSLIRKQHTLSFISSKEGQRIFINLENPLNKGYFSRTRIHSGIYQGLEMVNVSFWEKDLLGIAQNLLSINMRLKPVGFTPGWNSEEIFLMWDKQSPGDMVKILAKIDNLLDNQG